MVKRLGGVEERIIDSVLATEPSQRVDMLLNEFPVLLHFRRQPGVLTCVDGRPQGRLGAPTGELFRIFSEYTVI